MRSICQVIIVLLAMLYGISISAQEDSELITVDLELKGPSLGQKPPGDTPELFAPGIISRDDYFEHSAAIYSPDMKEVYWSGKPKGARYFEISFIKEINGKWTMPEIVFSHKDYSFDNPVFSSDGNQLFFDSRGDIWFVERIGNIWSEAVQVSPIINTNSSEAIRSITQNGSIYFTRYNANASREGTKHEMYVSRKIDGNYTEPVKLGKIINSDNVRELGLFVAPDESYMIIESSNEDKTSVKLNMHYRMSDGSWSERIKLNLGWGLFPSVSPDGKYLFYMSREGINWVNTSFINELKPNLLR
ncbi:MAG: hypothetical protein K8R58_13545 [Bacteroidales bacterium]|nr:hypothetical protein [Bacteroidales bacterium]